MEKFAFVVSSRRGKRKKLATVYSFRFPLSGEGYKRNANFKKHALLLDFVSPCSAVKSTQILSVWYHQLWKQAVSCFGSWVVIAGRASHEIPRISNLNRARPPEASRSSTPDWNKYLKLKNSRERGENGKSTVLPYNSHKLNCSTI